MNLPNSSNLGGSLVCLLIVLATCAGCAAPSAVTAPAPPAPAPAPAPPTPAPPTPAGARVALPAGQGREILIEACIGCHDLRGLELFKGFYTRDSWRALVLTMIENGAEVESPDIEVLSDYLAQHFGPGS